MNTAPRDDKTQAQIPALQVLAHLGYQCLTPAEALAARGGRTDQVLLEDILRAQLKTSNRIHSDGGSHLFSEENLQTAIERLKTVRGQGPRETHRAIHALLMQGVTLTQSIEGDLKRVPLQYVDWHRPERNVYHAVPDFAVEKNRSTDAIRPGIVLFVNGIPWAVIECCAPRVDVAQAVAQMIDHQREDGVPRLFAYAQMLLALNQHDARYGTTGTPSKFWSKWREDIDDAVLAPLLQPDLAERAVAWLRGPAQAQPGVAEGAARYLVNRQATTQDRSLYALCQPDRLLALARSLTVFESGERKLARWPQALAVRKVLLQVRQRNAAEQRRGGIVWHAQGAGKTLTLVMLARALALDPQIAPARIVLVTDRADRHPAWEDSFGSVGVSLGHANSLRQLMVLLASPSVQVITLLPGKLESKVVGLHPFTGDASQLFVLVDENHHRPLGTAADRMRQMFPHACCIGFTGTPLRVQDKPEADRLGGLIHAYPVDQAVADGAIVALLCDALPVEAATPNPAEGKAKGKARKRAPTPGHDEAEALLRQRATAIHAHYQRHWQGTGFKALLVAPDPAAALRYKALLDTLGSVRSELLIPPPDGSDRGAGPASPAVASAPVEAFWQHTMARHGSERRYRQQTLNAFRFGDAPEVLIVADRLPTGLNAPRAAVLYLTHPLSGHPLLQTLALLNRPCSAPPGGRDKTFGWVIDCAGVLGDSGEAAAHSSALAGFDAVDLNGWLVRVDAMTAAPWQRPAERAETAASPGWPGTLRQAGASDKTTRARQDSQQAPSTPRQAIRPASHPAKNSRVRQPAEAPPATLPSPAPAAGEPAARDTVHAALHDLLHTFAARHGMAPQQAGTLATHTAIALQGIVDRHRATPPGPTLDAQRDTANAIDDHLYDEVRDRQGLALSAGEMDELIALALQLPPKAGA